MYCVVLCGGWCGLVGVVIEWLLEEVGVGGEVVVECGCWEKLVKMVIGKV